ncbi:MAG: class I SAM-dependent methyltransferase [Acidobacteriota bacterium]
MQTSERLSRRFAFGEAACDYEAVRPGYPTALIQAVIDRAALGRQSTILEIGCGTGQATEAFAVLGCAMLCLEPALELAKLARQKIARFPQVQVSTETFEQAELAPESFDLVLAATSFHWIDATIRCAKVARVLRSAGTVAILTNTHPLPLVGFFVRVQDIYRAIAPTLAHKGDKSETEQWATELHYELVQSQQFEAIEFLSERWQKRFTGNEYLKLLNTFSPHRRLQEDQRNHLFVEIGKLIDTEYGGYVEQPYLTMLCLAGKIH